MLNRKQKFCATLIVTERFFFCFHIYPLSTLFFRIISRKIMTNDLADLENMFQDLQLLTRIHTENPLGYYFDTLWYLRF